MRNHFWACLINECNLEWIINIKYKIQLPVSLFRRIGFLLHFTSCLKVTSDSPNSRLINIQICGNLLYMQVKTQCLPDDSPTQILTVSATPCRVTGRNSICIHAPRPARAARARRTLVAKAYARNAIEDRIFARLHKTAVQLSRPSADRGGSGSARLIYVLLCSDPISRLPFFLCLCTWSEQNRILLNKPNTENKLRREQLTIVLTSLRNSRQRGVRHALIWRTRFQFVADSRRFLIIFMQRVIRLIECMELWGEPSRAVHVSTLSSSPGSRSLSRGRGAKIEHGFSRLRMREIFPRMNYA